MTDKQYRIDDYRIIGTNQRIVAVYEPTHVGFVGEPQHGTVKRFDDRWYGRVGTRLLPAELEALPHGEERIQRVTHWQHCEYLRAYGLIGTLVPDTRACTALWNMGECRILADNR